MEERLFTRDGVFLLLSTFLNSIPVGYINVVPLVYLAEIGYDPSTIGIIYSASAVAATVGLIPFGILADRHGKKGLLLLGTFLPCVSYAIFGLTLDASWLTVASIIGGVGFAGGLGAAIGTPSFIPMVADSTSEKKRATLFGVLQGTWALALTIGSALSFLPSLFHTSFAQSVRSAHSEVYFIMAGVAAAGIVPILFVKEKDKSSNPNLLSGSYTEGKAPYRSRKLPVTCWSRIAQFSAVFACTGFGLGVLVQLLPTWFTLRYGASESSIGFWMAVANLATIVAVPLIPRLVRRGGTISTGVTTGVLGALALALMPLTGFEEAAALFAIRSAAMAASWAVVQSYMMGAAGENERATVYAFTYTAWGLAVSLGTFVGGELFGAGLLTLPFVAAVISYLISSVALRFFFGKVEPVEEVTRFGLPRVSE